METDNSALSGQLVHLSDDEERTQFVAIGTDTSTNTQFRPTYRVNESKAPNPVFGAFGSYPWSVIQGFFSDWPTMSDQLLVLTQQEVDQYIPTGNVDDLTTNVTITKTILKGNTNFLYGDTYLPIDVEIPFKGSDLITDPAEPLELATDDKTVIGAVNENKDNTDSINTSFKSLERDLLYNAVGNYIAQNPALSSYYPSRLNTIPVITGDKIPSPDYTASNTISGFSLKEDSDVNLLEATWTAWQNITNLNTNMYGISATNMPELSSTALLAELSGNSVIENLNLLYNMYLSGGDAGSETGIDFTPVIDILSGDIGTNRTEIDTLKEAISALTQTESLSSVISSLTGLDTVTILNQLSGLTQSLSSLSALSADIADLETINTTLYDLDIPNLSACCVSNKDAIDILQLTLDNINTTELSGIAEMIQAIDIDTYVARLSSVEQQIVNLGDIQNYITQITDNSINIETVNTELSALTGSMQDQIDNLTGLVSNLDMDSLSSIVNNINNISNVNVLLEQLSGDNRINELSSCCNQNADAIANIDTQLTQNTVNIINNTTSIEQISANAGGTPDGVVLTTTNQTITGDKTFKSTMTVQASSYFEDCMTVGDTDQPIVFNVYSVDGQTRVNIKNLPTITQINDLSPGDLYIRTVDGHDLLAVKQQTGS